MDFKLEELSNAENELIKKAQLNYTYMFDNANNAVTFTWNFLSKVKPEAWIFVSFLSQVQKGLVLGLLSTLRKHEVQGFMMLRHVLESAVLACYGLYKPDLAEFGHIDSEGCAQVDEKAKDKAYKWIENNYSSFSKTIKFMKDTINKAFAHSSILLTPNTFEFEDNAMRVTFFDKDDDLMLRQRLWWIANIAIGLLNLFSEVIHDYPLVELVDGFADKMRALAIENERIKKELMQDPRFARWL